MHGAGRDGAGGMHEEGRLHLPAWQQPATKTLPSLGVWEEGHALSTPRGLCCPLPLRPNVALPSHFYPATPTALTPDWLRDTSGEYGSRAPRAWPGRLQPGLQTTLAATMCSPQRSLATANRGSQRRSLSWRPRK